jgi:hypothetical protein
MLERLGRRWYGFEQDLASLAAHAKLGRVHGGSRHVFIGPMESVTMGALHVHSTEIVPSYGLGVR